MSYLFIKKISFKEKSLYYSHKKLKIYKKPQKTPKKPKKPIFIGFFRWAFLGFFGWEFLGGFFWVGFFGWVFYCKPCMEVAEEEAKTTTAPDQDMLEATMDIHEMERGTVALLLPNMAHIVNMFTMDDRISESSHESF